MENKYSHTKLEKILIFALWLSWITLIVSVIIIKGGLI